MTIDAFPGAAEATTGQFAEPAAALDPAEALHYRSLLADIDLPEAQVVELLTILHDIMSRFVHLGWDVNLACEYVFADCDLCAEGNHDAL